MNRTLFWLTALALLFVMWQTTCAHLDNTNGCETNCNQTYNPVCGTDESGKTKNFNNECILKFENCIHKTNYQRTANGTCP